MVTEALTQAGVTGNQSIPPMIREDGRPARWVHAKGYTPYPDALTFMKERARAIAEGTTEELVWLVEHPPLYTAGTSAKPNDLILPDHLPVYPAGRGGQYTYHGPGQRVAYVMLDLRARSRDIRKYVCELEQWVIDTLSAFNIKGERRNGRIGVWVPRPDQGVGREDKIAAIGVRVSRWVSFHGISLNINPDLDHYAGIVPCGITDQGVTSFEDLGQLVSIEEVDTVLRHTFESRFGNTLVSESTD